MVFALSGIGLVASFAARHPFDHLYNPRRAQAAYEASARLAGWDTTTFESKWCPTPTQLQQLLTAAG
jgi:hypothetical protein